MNYLVFKTGYEGIDEVFGVFNRDRALQFVTEKKDLATKSKKLGDELKVLQDRISEKHAGDYEKYKADPELAAFKAEHGDDHHDDPDFWCVVTVSETGTKCVCKDLGVGASKLMLR